MNDSIEIYLLRHTPVDVPKGLCYGQLEVPLAQSYHGDLKQVFAVLDRIGGFTHVFTSPSRRCEQLAHGLISLWDQGGRPVFCQTLEDLKEVSFGSWEGKSWDEIDPAEVNSWYEDFVKTRPSGGESLEDLCLRAQRGYSQLRDLVKGVSEFDQIEKNTQKNRILVVSHGGWIRSLMCFLLDIPLASAFKLNMDYGYLAGFAYQGQRPLLKLIHPCLEPVGG